MLGISKNFEHGSCQQHWNGPMYYWCPSFQGGLQPMNMVDSLVEGHTCSHIQKLMTLKHAQHDAVKNRPSFIAVFWGASCTQIRPFGFKCNFKMSNIGCTGPFKIQKFFSPSLFQHIYIFFTFCHLLFPSDFFSLSSYIHTYHQFFFSPFQFTSFIN